MRISHVKKTALSALEGNWSKAIGLTFIMFLFYGIFLNVIDIILSGGFDNWTDENYYSPLAEGVNILLSLVAIPLSVGVSWFFLQIIRLEKPEISYAFSLYQNGNVALKALGVSIVQGIFIFFWTLLLIIPGLIKAIAYSQVFYILKDKPELGVLETITESRRIMDGYKFKYFLLVLSFIGWAFLCLFTFGIGFLWLVPYVSASTAAFYEEISLN